MPITRSTSPDMALLTILYTERHGKIRVVTAYEMTKPQQQMYFEGK